MDGKTFLAVLAFVVLAGLAYWLQDELFEYLTQPEAQVDVGREMGVVRDSEKREAGAP